MTARVYWINSQLAIVPRPRGGDSLDNEMLALREVGIDLVVSLLETDEAAELGLQEESDAASESGLSFIRFPIPDGGVPQSAGEFKELLSRLEDKLAAGKRTGVHCKANIGRSSIVTVSLLVRSGVPHDVAWRQVENARGYIVPDTDEQKAWVNRNIRARTDE